MSIDNKISWSNIQEIVDDLINEFPQMGDREYVCNLNFVKLKETIFNLENFEDDGSCNEKKLEAIQQHLLDEIV